VSVDAAIASQRVLSMPPVRESHSDAYVISRDLQFSNEDSEGPGGIIRPCCYAFVIDRVADSEESLKRLQTRQEFLQSPDRRMHVTLL
jgi:hypothetical protein